MQKVSDNYRNYIKENLALSPKSKIVVDGIEYLGDIIKSAPKFSHSNKTFIGGFPTKTVNFEMYNFDNNIDFEDKEIEIYKGYVVNGTIEYVKQGVFIPRASDIENNISTKTIAFKNVEDRTQLLQNVYTSTLDWSTKHTGLEIVLEICDRNNLELETLNFNFANYLFNQPNISAKTTDREVISRIAEIGGEIAIFNNNGKVAIKGQTPTGDIIERKRYKTLSREKKYEPNLLVIGNEGYDNDIMFPYPKPNDSVELKIEDNPFVDLYREEMIEDVSENVLNLSYIPFIMTDFVDGFYYELNDVVTILDKNGQEFNAVILDISTSSRIKSSVKAPVKEESLSNYNLAGSNKQSINEVKFEVNHIKNEINAVVSETNEMKEDLNNLSTPILTKQGNNHICIEEALESNAIEYSIDGKSEQNGDEIKTIKGIKDIDESHKGYWLKSKITNSEEIERYIEKNVLVDMNKSNLFDKNNANILNAYLAGATSTITTQSVARTLYISCKPNTTYTIEKIKSENFSVATTTNEPNYGVSYENRWVRPNSTITKYSYTTNDNANYLLVQYSDSSNTVDEQLILDSIKIYEGYGSSYELCSIDDVKDNLEVISGKLIKRIGKNENGYYILDEEEIIQLPPTNVPLFEGENHIQLEEDIETNTSIRFYRQNALNEAYYTKSENDAQFKITSDQINSTVSSTKTELKNDLNDINNNLNNNFYQKKQVEQLVLDSSNGLTNTFSEAGGNNILRNTNFSAKEVLEEGQNYEYWYGNAIRNVNGSSVNGYSILLQDNSFYQEQSLANGNYTLSFYYKKTNPLANIFLKINDNQYELSSTDFSLFQTGIKDENDSYIIDPIVITDNYVKVEFISDINNACEVYDIMLNAGKVKLAYSQNQNETITDTVNIGRGISIKSSASETEFVATNENIGFKNSSGNFTTEFNSKGMSTNEAVIQNEAEIVGILRQRVGDQIWDCMI